MNVGSIKYVFPFPSGDLESYTAYKAASQSSIIEPPVRIMQQTSNVNITMMRNDYFTYNAAEKLWKPKTRAGEEVVRIATSGDVCYPESDVSSRGCSERGIAMILHVFAGNYIQYGQLMGEHARSVLLDVTTD